MCDVSRRENFIYSFAEHYQRTSFSSVFAGCPSKKIHVFIPNSGAEAKLQKYPFSLLKNLVKTGENKLGELSQCFFS